MLVIQEEIVTLVKLVHSENVLAPMLVIPEGIVILVKPAL
jgi:hypothetical protein